MTGSSSLDVSAIVESKLTYRPCLDTVDDVKTPQIEKYDFTVGDLEFHLIVRGIVHEKYFYAVDVDLTERGREKLVEGSAVSVLQFTRESALGTSIPLDVSTPRCVSSQPVELYKTREKDPRVESVIMKFEGLYAYRLRFMDAEVAKKNGSDCKIVLVDDEDKPVYVNRQFLAYRSSYFQKLFFGDSKNKDQEVVSLTKLKENDFLEYLYHIYLAPNRSLAFNRLDTLLRLAQRFGNEALTASIKKFMLEKKDLTPKKKRKALVWADFYKMPEVFSAALKTMDKADLKPLRGATSAKFNEDNLELYMGHVFDLFR